MWTLLRIPREPYSVDTRGHSSVFKDLGVDTRDPLYPHLVSTLFSTDPWNDYTPGARAYWLFGSSTTVRPHIAWRILRL